MSVDTKVRSNPLRRRLRRLSRWQRCEEAAAFIEAFFREHDLPEVARKRRLRQVTADIVRHDYYEHTPEELAYGARVAWRNQARCIGRLLWKSLEVVDCRALKTPDAIASRMFDHLEEAGGRGAIRSIISVFPPVRGSGFRDAMPAYIESRQILQYAGYPGPMQSTLGDPLNAEFTRIATSLGWKAPANPGLFDILPLLIRDSQGRRVLYEMPRSAVHEVDISHPAHPDLSSLRLKWYTVPCVSSMILSIGGIDYPCAPFNGHYMATEIASRNFADERRYDLLPAAARCFGIDSANEGSLWKDRALTELNEAVLHSFRREGVTIIDHHTASNQFMSFVHREEAAGRAPSADWAWIVPPQASAATTTFHLPMVDRKLVPNYYTSRASDGGALEPNYDDEIRSLTRRRWDRARMRWFAWRRLRD